MNISETVTAPEGEYLPRIENKGTFLARLDGQTWQDRELIIAAYDIAKVAHRGQVRASGERYFEHSRHVALILMDECGITDKNPIISALLHDAIEDTEMFGDYYKMSYSFWTQIAHFRIGKFFNKDVADTIVAITKPRVDGIEVFSAAQVREMNYDNLRDPERTSPEALLVKMADRLHNLRTLGALDYNDQVRIIAETENIYFFLFERAREKYPREAEVLINGMKEAICEIELAQNFN